MEKEPTDIATVDNSEVRGMANLPIDDHEHVVDIEDEEVQKEIAEAKRIFYEFSQEHRDKFDLSDEASILATLEAAKERGIFQAAERIRNLIYNKNISIYGVSYLSNVCNQNCKFCPQGVRNYEVYQIEQHLNSNPSLSQEERKKLQDKVVAYRKTLKTMTLDEAREDFRALTEIGHQEICVLSGEDVANDPVDYIQAALETPGIKEIILNLAAYSERQMRMIRENLQIPKGVRLQYRVFQETYDPDAYFYFVEHAPIQWSGGKHDMYFRFHSQDYAISAGIDEVGIGVLFGLTKYPLSEIEGLYMQASYLTTVVGKEPKRCCLPLGNEPDYVHVDIPYMVSRIPKASEITELIYALARLAMPTVSIVSSERDGPEMLKILDKYANHTTLFVHPGPGRNIESFKELKTGGKIDSTVVEQAATVARQPREAILDWLERGYHVLGFNWEKYLSAEELRKYAG